MLFTVYSYFSKIMQKSETSATIHGSLLFLTWSARSRLLAAFPMDVGTLCGSFGSSRNEGGLFGRPHEHAVLAPSCPKRSW